MSKELAIDSSVLYPKFSYQLFGLSSLFALGTTYCNGAFERITILRFDFFIFLGFILQLVELDPF